MLQNSLNASEDDLLLTIGHSLRARYDDLLQEGVPTRSSTLIQRLENAESEIM